MTLERIDLGKEAKSRGATTGDAKLAGLPGKGTLQVWRGQSDDVLKVVGTWRLEENAGALEKIRQAAEQSTPVRYDGVLDDPAQPEKERVATEVYVTSIGSYQPNNGANGSYCYVNFVPAQPEAITG